MAIHARGFLLLLLAKANDAREDEILVVGGVENAGLVGIDVEVHGFP